MTASLAYQILPRRRYSQGDIVLVPLRHEDLLPIMGWRNAQIDVLRQDRRLTPDDQERYWERVLLPDAGLAHPDQILFSILRDSRCVGYGGLVHIDWRRREAEVSFLVDTAITRDASDYGALFSTYLSLIRTIAFGEFDLRSLVTETYDIRPHHVRTLEAAGFQLQQVVPKHVVVAGRPVDSLIHRLTETVQP